MITGITDEVLVRPADDPLLELRMAVIKVRSRSEAARAAASDWSSGYAAGVDDYLGGPVGEYAGLFSPQAGLELAGWLESVVKRLERQEPGQEARGEGPVALADKAAAFTIARALLGRMP